MKEPIWISESNRPEQRVAFIAAICYCAAIFLDVFMVRIPFLYFEINIILVGIGYIISSFKSNVGIRYLSIGILWIFVGMIIGVDFEHKFLGIPMAIIGSHTGYFLIMCILATTIIKRRFEYFNFSSYLFCFVFSIFMAMTHIVAFFAIGTKLKYFDFSNILLHIGGIVMRLSNFSIIEFFSMLVVVFSMSLQTPKLLLFYDESQEETEEVNFE